MVGNEHTGEIRKSIHSVHDSAHALTQSSGGLDLLEVIGAAFGRTGTASLKTALEILGFGKCYHFSEMLRARHVGRWLKTIHDDHPDWDALFEGYAATTDWPAATYYRELVAAYPNAKVILTTRDADSWHRSVLTTIYPLRKALPRWLPWFRSVSTLCDTVIWNGTFGGRIEERAEAIAIYEQHEANVRALVPSERLLTFDVRDGWGPLCDFLAVPVPEGIPFPHVNEGRRIRRIARLLVWAQIFIACFLVAAAILIIT